MIAQDAIIENIEDNEIALKVREPKYVDEAFGIGLSLESYHKLGNEGNKIKNTQSCTRGTGVQKL